MVFYEECPTTTVYQGSINSSSNSSNGSGGSGGSSGGGGGGGNRTDHVYSKAIYI